MRNKKIKLLSLRIRDHQLVLVFITNDSLLIYLAFYVVQTKRIS